MATMLRNSALDLARARRRLVPTVLILGFIAAPLSAHVAGVRAPWSLVAGGVLSVTALSVIAARLTRGAVLRWGSGTPRQPRTSPRSRSVAHGAGILASVALAGAALGIQSGAATGTLPHTISSIAVAVNAGIVILATVPVPGFGGWALLLARVDLAAPLPRDRVRRAAAGARVAALAVGIAGLPIALATAEPLAAAFGAGLGAVIWVRAGAAVAVDAAERFFAGRMAKDLARPLTAVRGPHVRLADLDRRSRGEAALVVSGDGELLGAFGPRQVRAASQRHGHGARCEDAMVPFGALPLAAGSAPATVLIPALADFGFAVVRSDAGIAVVEAADVQRQVRVWARIEELGRRRRLGGNA